MKAGNIFNWLIRYKLFHVLYWSWAFIRVYHEKLHFFGKNSLLIPNVINDIFFQMAGVYLILYYVRPKFFYQHQYSRFIIFSIATISLISVLHVLGGIFLGFLYSGATYNGIWIVLIVGFVDTFIKAAIFVTAVELFRWFQVEQQNKRLEKEKLEHELAFLKAQINPHFIFNTLNSVYVLMDINKEKAAETLLKFSSMLRYQLYDCGGNLIELEKELSLLEDFIALESMRKGADIKISHSFSVKSNSFRIAPLLLIPIVENAFKHVSVDKEGYNFIQIEATLNNDTFWLETINSCNNEHLQEAKSEGGIGLKNIKRRLELLYPGTHELEIKNENDIFTVKLCLHDT
jgi:sensor histidine kinase YesM